MSTLQIETSRPHVYLSVLGMPEPGFLHIVAYKAAPPGSSQPEAILLLETGVDVRISATPNNLGDGQGLSVVAIGAVLSIPPGATAIVRLHVRREQDKPQMGAAALEDWPIALELELDSKDAKDMVVRASAPVMPEKTSPAPTEDAKPENGTPHRATTNTKSG